MASIKTSILPDRNFTEWHKGIRLYGFWCIEVNDDQWLECLSGVRTKFCPQLMADYQRFPHITIATVGLMNDDNWQIVKQQVDLLQSLKLSSVEVSWMEVSSYDHSPMVRVNDFNNDLCILRKSLHSISKGDDSSVFDPHITLGYYSKLVHLENIQDMGKNCGISYLKHLTVNSIKFCTYETHSIKGPISVSKTVELP